MVNVHPQTLIETLKHFLTHFDEPLIAKEGDEHFQRCQKLLKETENSMEELLAALQALLDNCPLKATAVIMLRFLHDLRENPVNGITEEQIMEHFLPYFVWSLRTTTNTALRIFELMLSNISLLAPEDK